MTADNVLGAVIGELLRQLALAQAQWDALVDIIALKDAREQELLARVEALEARLGRARMQNRQVSEDIPITVDLEPMS